MEKGKVKKESLKLVIDGKETSFHSLVLVANEKWNQSVSLFALEKFVKKELTLKTSPLKAIFDHFELKAEKVDIDLMKAILSETRLIDSKGKKRKKFSCFSFLKDLQNCAETGNLNEILKRDKKALIAENEAKETNRINSIKKAS